MMTAEQAIEYIHSVCWKGSIPGLGRTQTLLEKMGNPEKKLKFIHIAGTNGKGSTAAMTASMRECRSMVWKFPMKIWQRSQSM